MFKTISVLFFLGGVLGMITSLLGFVYLNPTMANLFIISVGFGMSGCMAIVAGHELLKSKRD
jgi:hypothetical protein